MKRGTPNHPKLLKLARALGIPAAHAAGLLEFLWHWTSKYAIQGDIGRWSDEDIAAGSGWEDSGRIPEFVGKLLETGWIDSDPVHRYLIHDWSDHADDSVRKTLKNRKLEIFRNVSGKVPNDSGKVSPALAFPFLSIASPEPDASGSWGPMDDWFDEWFDSVYERHPRKTGKAMAKTTLQRLLADAANPGAVAEAIDLKHTAMCESEQWTKEHGKYAKSLDKWIADRGWEDDLPTPEPSPYITMAEYERRQKAGA